MAVIRSFALPTVEARPAPAVAIPANAALGAFGNPAQAAGNANALLQASNQLGQAAETFDRAAIEQRNIADETYVQDQSQKYQSERRKLLYTNPDAFYTLKGEAAIKGMEPTMQALEALKQEYLGKANNDRQRRALTKSLDFLTGEAENGMSRHVAAQSLVWQDAVAKGKVANGINEATDNYNDPSKVTLHLQGAADTEYQRVLKDTGSPEAATAAARAVTSNGYKSVIQLMAVNDPLKAQRFLEANRDKIDAGDAPALTATIKNAVTARRAQDITSIVGATGGVSPSYNSRVGGAENGGSYQGENKIGALGKYQMIPSTYTSLGQETDWGKGKSQAEIRQMLLDPKEGPGRQDELQGKYNDRSVAALSKAGVPVNDLTLYTAHFLGQSAGPAILKLPDDTPLQAGLLKAHGGDAAFVQKVNEANPFLAKVETVGDLKVLMAQKIGAPQSLATGSPTKPNLDAMLAAGLALAGDDPDLRDRVTSSIKTDYATKHAIYTAQIGALEKQAFAHIDAGGGVENLPPQVRAGLDADGLTKVQAYEAKLTEKRRKEKAEEASKSLTDLEKLGQLTPDEVAKARNVLPANEYRSWNKIAAGDDRIDDPATYERIQRGLGSRDMRDDIFAAHNAGDISNQTRNAFLSKNDAFLKEGAPSSPYMIGHRYVTGALDPGLMGAGISRQTAASGIKEYDQYVAANPQREGETTDAYAKRLDLFAQDVVKRWSLINTQEMAVSLPVPANATFNRSAMSTLPKPEASKEISRAYQALQKNFAEGRITQDQLDADSIALMKWLDYVQKRPEAPATPAPKK